MVSLSPHKYYAGLSKAKATRRRKEIEHGKRTDFRDPSAYKPFATNKGVKTRKSGYTARWKRKFPQATSLEQKAAATGVPLKYIRESYNRGLAAWRTGHRPGATEQQWGYARVHSFLLCGKTYQTTDSDIARKAKAASASAKAWWAQTC
jgi:hypothetical protein